MTVSKTIIPKDWLTIYELAERWRIDSDIIRHYAETNQLRLSVHLLTAARLLQHPELKVKYANDAGIFEIVDPRFHRLAAINRLYGYHFLPILEPGRGLKPQLRDDAGNFFFIHFPGSDWPPPRLCDLEIVIRRAEVEHFEREHSNELALANCQSDSSRERDTLLKLMAAMAIDGYGWDGIEPFRLAKEIEKSVAARGMKISARTLGDKLKEAAQYLPPKKT